MRGSVVIEDHRCAFTSSAESERQIPSDPISPGDVVNQLVLCHRHEQKIPFFRVFHIRNLLKGHRNDPSPSA